MVPAFLKFAASGSVSVGAGVESDQQGNFDVRWYPWWDVQSALAHGRIGGIALHHFRYDLRRFGLGVNDPACHIISADREALITFGGSFGLRAAWMEPPRRHRPDIWHFDVFGPLLLRLLDRYPLPPGLDERPADLATGQ